MHVLIILLFVHYRIPLGFLFLNFSFFIVIFSLSIRCFPRLLGKSSLPQQATYGVDTPRQSQPGSRLQWAGPEHKAGRVPPEARPRPFSSACLLRCPSCVLRLWPEGVALLAASSASKVFGPPHALPPLGKSAMSFSEPWPEE